MARVCVVTACLLFCTVGCSVEGSRTGAVTTAAMADSHPVARLDGLLQQAVKDRCDGSRLGARTIAAAVAKTDVSSQLLKLLFTLALAVVIICGLSIAGAVFVAGTLWLVILWVGKSKPRISR